MLGILSDTEISKAIHAGEIGINPFNSAQLNVTSYDLTLGNEVLVYRDLVRGTPADGKGTRSIQGLDLQLSDGVLDAQRAPRTEAWKFDESGFLLKPGIGYLMHTRESVWTQKYNPILAGKAEVGRLFIQVQTTAGYGDPGFAGQYTLEVTVQHAVRVYPGMRIAQIRFHQIHGNPTNMGYLGGEAAYGAKPSEAWRQFMVV
jgi:dCTP deaminase